jgi:hypothetical protein
MLAPIALLLGIVTIADHGVVFQPALSPDGQKVAYAEDERSAVAIHVAPAAGGDGKRIAVVDGEEGVLQGTGVRLASAGLRQPWSADGSTLLCLRQVPNNTDVMLYAAGPDGGWRRALQPAKGLIENASFAGDKIIFTHRDSRKARNQTIYAEVPDGSHKPEPLFEYSKDELVIDMAPAPDGKWIAALVLTGPRDARVRSLVAIDTSARAARTLATPTEANFLSWAGGKLFWLDTLEGLHVVGSWSEGAPAADPPMPIEVVRVLPVLDGAWLLANDAQGKLLAIETATQKTQVLGQDFVATSAAAGKVALVRRGAQGAAILVADISKEALAAGDIGLPKKAP